MLNVALHAHACLRDVCGPFQFEEEERKKAAQQAAEAGEVQHSEHTTEIKPKSTIATI